MTPPIRHRRRSFWDAATAQSLKVLAVFVVAGSVAFGIVWLVTQ